MNKHFKDIITYFEKVLQKEGVLVRISGKIRYVKWQRQMVLMKGVKEKP
jgi:hypothetical protein